MDSSKKLYGKQFGTLKIGRMSYGNTWDNYRIEVDTENHGGFDQGIMFRKADDNNYYEVNLRFDDGAGRYNTPEVKLVKKQAGTSSTLLSTRTFQLNRFTNYKVKIEVVQTHIQVWIGTTLIFDVDDPTTTVAQGPIALSYWTGDYGSVNVRFDNVKITSLTPINPILPVIFIPGIGGSELKTNSVVNWNYDNGRGGIFTRQYLQNETVWVNTSEAAALGDDDYFDVLKMDNDGTTSLANVATTGNLVAQGYGDIDSFFQDINYLKGTNFFIFAYDWRKDITTNKSSLDALVEYAKAQSGKSKVNIVAHSMGGLVAQNYIADSEKASKVNKLIKLGVPHLGSTEGIKSLLYGTSLKTKVFGIIPLGIPESEIKDVALNMPAMYTLLPSNLYYSFYNNGNNQIPFPFNDLRDYDQNGIIGPLNYYETKSLLLNSNLNSTIFNFGEQYHATQDALLNQSNGVQIYNIVGTSQPTLGQIVETTYSIWPFSLLAKTEELFINGDEIVPLYSASLTNGSLDLTAGATTYYVGLKHNELVAGSKVAMQTVKAILQNDTIPTEVQSQRIALEGKQISTELEIDLYDSNNNHTGLDSNGEIENNIPNTYYDSINNNKNIFVKNNAGAVKLKLTSKKKQSANIKIRTYANDLITQTVYYKDVPVKENTVIELDYDPNSFNPPTLPIEGQIINPTSITTGSNVLDTVAPATSVNISGNKDASGNYSGPVTIILNSSDTGSGLLKTEYSLDNGVSVNVYSQPFVITGPGQFTLQLKSIDKVGNEELVQTFKFTILGSELSSSATNNDIREATTPASSNQPKFEAKDLFEKIDTREEAQKILGATVGLNTNPSPEKQINIWSYLLLPILILLLLIASLLFSIVKPSPK